MLERKCALSVVAFHGHMATTWKAENLLASRSGWSEYNAKHALVFRLVSLCAACPRRNPLKMERSCSIFYVCSCWGLHIPCFRPERQQSSAMAEHELKLLNTLLLKVQNNLSSCIASRKQCSTEIIVRATVWGSVRWGKPCLQFGWVDECSNWTLISNCNVQLPCSKFYTAINAKMYTY